MKKANSHFQWRWNSSSSRRIVCLALLLLLLAAPAVHAINVAAVYSSACQRETGMIIDADDSKIRLLTLDGEIRRIDRFDIVYMAYYPVGEMPVPQVAYAEDIDLIEIKTIYEDEVVNLVKGWMIDAAEDRVSFLTVNGKETVLDYADIWDIDIMPLHDTIRFPKVRKRQYRFVHPYPFQYCNGEAETDSAADPIYPQHLLEDPILIKKELDRLKEGYDRLKGFHNDKVYYPKPQVYGNDARLGLWAVFGARHGGTEYRKNNFIPEITSEYSSGPFGFQHILVTGNALMPSGVHEEPQMHFYYGLKADYVHFAIMVDFNRYVIGESKYQWHAEDLLTNDHRDNDTLNVAGGFDYGHFAIDVSIWNRVQYGVRVGDNFHEGSLNLNKGGLFFENRTLRAELYYGFGDDKKQEEIPVPDNANPWEIAYIEAYNAYLAQQPPYVTDYVMARLNLTLFAFSPFNPRYSLIFREIDFRRELNLQGEGAFRYKGASLTNAVTFDYPFDDEIRFAGFLSVEVLENRHGVSSLSDSDSTVFPKGGVSAALIF